MTKLNSSGTPIYSTYLGDGVGGVGIAADSSGDAYVTGGAGGIPLVNPIQSTTGIGGSAFVTEFNPAGSALVSEFTVAPGSGQSSSQTVTAGQTATFNLAVTPTGSFAGSVTLSCAITPVVTPAPNCSLPGSVTVTAGAAAPFAVMVSTIASTTTGAASYPGFPAGWVPLSWAMALSAAGLMSLLNRRRLTTSVAPIIVLVLVLVLVLALASLVGCGGSSSSSHTTPGTPSGTYTATVTASSGSQSQNMSLTVVVQ